MIVHLLPRSSFSIWIIGLMLVGSGAAPGWAAPPTPDLEAGRTAYQQSCTRCHGDQGHGDGVDAKRFYPRPRDLTMGVYKFRGTVSGTPPTDDDLFRTITDGLPGSNMPDWRHLDEATRWQLVYYLKSLSPVFEQAQPEPFPVAADPGPAHADLAKGRRVYEQLGCAACHGPQGRANGSSAAGLVDDWGKPIRPANLTKGWSYRGGSEPHAVMLRLLAGIDGAGMPSYAGAVSPEDAWQLAYYVASLQEAPHWNLVTRATRITGFLPTTVDDPRWAQAQRTDLRVRNAVEPTGEWTQPPTLLSVAVQVLFTDEAAAFRVVWDDPSHDSQGSPDRLALVLRPAGVAGDVVTLQAWPYIGGPSLDACSWAADTEQTVETVATDMESLISGGGSGARLSSAARYEDGRWILVVERPLRQPSMADAAVIGAGRFTPIAVVVWDGSNGGARAVSGWLDVAFDVGNSRATRNKED